jgi:hypothetical protein
MKMKSKKILNMLVAGMLFSLMLVAFPASQAFAATKSINLDPEEGEIGVRVDIDGDNFTPSDEAQSITSEVDIYFSGDEAAKNDDIDNEVADYELMKSSVSVDEDGQFSTYFKIPAKLTDGEDDVDVKGGTYYVYVTEADDETILAVAEFTVLSAEIELDPIKGTVGTKVDIAGVDFAGSKDITVEFDSDDLDIESGDDRTDSSGDFDCTVIIPEGAAGKHTITVTDDSDMQAEATFTVEPDMTVTPDKAVPGESITVSGTGFGDSIDVIIDFDGSEVKAGKTDKDGSFQFSFNVPFKSAGSYEIVAEDDDRNDAKVDFTVTSTANISKTAGNVGDTFIVSGAGFTPNSAITIVFITERITTSADANGEFSSTVTVPSGQSGAQSVTVSGGSTTLSMTFTVDSTAPQSPQPLLPANGEKVESQTRLDWRDVTDPSAPVTYTLQISTDSNFSSTLLEKTGLTKSEYTLSAGEKLSPGSQGTPYYWRVQAVDAAGNESPWTGRGSFYISFSLLMLPAWVKYVLIGVGGAVLFLVGYLLGRSGRA